MIADAAAHVPSAARHELRRDRLLELLHRHSERPLVVLLAPAGFGKSTLAAQYARGSGAATAWLTVAEQDRDSRALLTRIGAALQAALEVARLPSLERGLRDGATGGGLSRRLLEDLQAATTSFLLVLDDFHVLGDAEEAVQAVVALARDLPEFGQVVVTARQMPSPFPTTEVVAQGLMFSLGLDDLRFDEGEAQALQERLGSSDESAARAEGWVAGILLGGASRSLGADGGTLLASYVQNEVLRPLRPAERRWLEDLSVLDRITPAAARHLLGSGYWAARLSGLAERCPFLVGDPEHGYSLHALVRDVLVDRLRRRGGTGAQHAWRTAREMALQAGDWPAAVRASRELGEDAEAVALVQRSVDEAIRAGRWSVAVSLLDLLPEEQRRLHPWLSLAEAYALFHRGRIEAARAVAEAALDVADRTGNLLARAGAVVELASIARYNGNLSAAFAYLDDARSAAQHHPEPDPRLPRIMGRERQVRAVCTAERGDVAAARLLLEEAEGVLRGAGPSREHAVTLNNLGALYFRNGEYSAAERALAAATAQYRHVGDRQQLATVQIAHGNLLLNAGQLEEAASVLDGALQAARAVGDERAECHALIALGRWHRRSGRPDEAAARLAEAIELAQDRVTERDAVVRAFREAGEVALLRGNLDQARHDLRHAHADAQTLGAAIELAACERAIGRLALVDGDAHGALLHFQAALERAGAAWSPGERAATHYWTGTAELVAGRSAAAEATLSRALEVAEAPGVMAALGSAAAEDARLLELGLDHGLHSAHLAVLARTAALRRPWTLADVTPATAPRLSLVPVSHPPHVELWLFGRPRLAHDGEPVPLGARVGSARTGRALELVAFLAAHPRGESLTSREVADVLWPEMLVERGLHNLRNTTWEARRLLGSKRALHVAQSTIGLAPQEEVWVDVRAFQAAVQAARSARSTDEAIRHMEEAVDLYRGPLLEEKEWPWLAGLRTAMASTFADVALRLGGHLLGRDPRAAEELVKRVLAEHPTSLPALTLAARAARARGDRQAAAEAESRAARARRLVSDQRG